jgi:hypothetical protein
MDFLWNWALFRFLQNWVCVVHVFGFYNVGGFSWSQHMNESLCWPLLVSLARTMCTLQCVYSTVRVQYSTVQYSRLVINLPGWKMRYISFPTGQPAESAWLDGCWLHNLMGLSLMNVWIGSERPEDFTFLLLGWDRVYQLLQEIAPILENTRTCIVVYVNNNNKYPNSLSKFGHRNVTLKSSIGSSQRDKSDHQWHL